MKSRRNSQYGNKNNQKRDLDHYFYLLYRFFNSFPVTRGYIKKIAYRYRLISPCDTNTIARKTVSICLISWTICLSAFSFIYLSNPQLISFIIAGAAIILVNSEVIGHSAKIFEITALQEIQRMIANVEHNFYVEYRVDDALYRSKDSLSANMKKTAEQIYQLLLSDDKEEALQEYYENVLNRYLRAFVSQCIGVMERGDQTVDGKRLFVKNMENLQRELDIEIDKLQRLQMEFIGVIFCVIAPVFCIDFVKSFAVSIKENMNTFFYGKEGFLLDITLLTVIFCIYFIMRKSAEYAPFQPTKHQFLNSIDRIPIIKKALDNYCDKNASKVERLKRELRNNGSNISARHFKLFCFLLVGVILILGIGISCYLHKLNKEQLLSADRADMEALTSAAKESQYETMGELIETYTKRYLFETAVQIPENEEEMVSILESDDSLNNAVINKALAKEILRRVATYQKEYVSLTDIMVCLGLSAVGYCIPVIILKYNSMVSKDAMEDEVNQFNALICMLMHFDSMTVKQVLEELEGFAVVFKQSLRSCINDYGSGDLEALNNLKEREPFESFQRIVDNLIRCDEMPIYEAFHEVDVERDGYMAKRKLANEKSIRKRVFRAYMLAALPFLLLFVYGLVPTLIASMNELNAMLNELENSAW